MINGYN